MSSLHTLFILNAIFMTLSVHSLKCEDASKEAQFSKTDKTIPFEKWSLNHKHCWSKCVSSKELTTVCSTYDSRSHVKVPSYMEPPECGLLSGKKRAYCGPKPGFSSLEICNKHKPCISRDLTAPFKQYIDTLELAKGTQCRTRTFEAKKVTNIAVQHCPPGTQPIDGDILMCMTSIGGFVMDKETQEYQCKVTAAKLTLKRQRGYRYLDGDRPDESPNKLVGYWIVEETKGAAVKYYDIDGQLLDKEPVLKDEGYDKYGASQIPGNHNAYQSWDNVLDDGYDGYGDDEEYAEYMNGDEYMSWKRAMGDDWEEDEYDEGYYDDMEEEFDGEENMEIIKSDLRDARLRLEMQLRQRNRRKDYV